MIALNVDDDVFGQADAYPSIFVSRSIVISLPFNLASIATGTYFG